MPTNTTINVFYDYPRAALRAQKLAMLAYAEGRTDMDSRDQGEISTVYGLPWEAMGTELQGDFYSWWFAGIGKAANDAPQKYYGLDDAIKQLDAQIKAAE